MECYKEFAHIYDELINGDIDYRKWGQFILETCEQFSIEKEEYLDLACGTGNITEEIAPHFKNRWGVDLSSDMLTEAEDKLRKHGIKSKFICQDICKLQLNKKFNLITCCLDSTNYILENENIESYFEKVSQHLKEDGIFIFDINSYYKLENILGNNLYHYDEEDVVYIWQNSFENEIVSMDLTFFIKCKGLYERFDEQHLERAYTESYLENTMKKSGLRVLKKIDNYENKLVQNDTERIVYIVKKA